ncbi:MAG: hypothetical protein E7460_05100 [Ruminococcaceae bacterium]|nr:hypothetical protein [Oscillospiraceae bacterium]
MTAGTIAISLSVSLGLTLAAETLFVAAAKKPPADILLSVLANVATNPPVNALHILLCSVIGLPPVPVIAVLEILALCAEALLYRTCGREIKKPFLFSLAANGISFSLGLVFNAVINLII